jgi:GrpB-like predicted nucleotidyltransferase (UPF0157 family)
MCTAENRGSLGVNSSDVGISAYHLHLTTIGSRFWRDHLTFRDRLRADNALRDAYAALKHDLASRFPRDREAYIAGKESFVNEVLGMSVRSG